MKLPKDKILHFTAGALCALIAVTALHMLFTVTPATLILVGIIASFAVGGIKEEVDFNTPGHTFDGWDAYWTVAGGIFAMSALHAVRGFL